MKPNPYTVAIIAGGVGLALVALLIWRKGGVAGAAKAVGSAAVDAAGGIVVGTVDTAGAAVGLPSSDETTQDPAVARWIIDNHGYFEASRWASAAALVKGAWMESGTGTPPPAGSKLAAALPAPASKPATAPVTSTVYRSPVTDVGDASFGDLVNSPAPGGWFPKGY